MMMMKGEPFCNFTFCNLYQNILKTLLLVGLENEAQTRVLHVELKALRLALKLS
jgi:hypothetical protein